MFTNPTPFDEVGLIQRTATALQQLGLDAHILQPPADTPRLQVDGCLRVGKGDTQITYAVEVKRTLTPATLGAATAQMRHAAEMTGLPGLLVTDCFSTPMAEKLRGQKQPFADAAGNAYLEGPGLLVYVTGRKLKDKPLTAMVGKAFTTAGLKVQFALICNPALAEAPHRAIAAAAGVALGVIPAVLADLQQAGHVLVQGKQRRLNASRRFLDEWALDYARRLRPKTLRATYVTPSFDAWERWDIDRDQALWGGEPAARLLVQHLRPGVLTLYAEKMPARLMVTQRMVNASAALADGRVVELRKPFWGTLPADGPSGIVPPALVYADLLATGDSRCLETAEMIYDRCLARLFPVA
ncbi:type IV toxin-antitoxin system AbiEi family antitoxin [soil metagenome]